MRVHCSRRVLGTSTCCYNVTARTVILLKPPYIISVLLTFWNCPSQTRSCKNKNEKYDEERFNAEWKMFTNLRTFCRELPSFWQNCIWIRAKFKLKLMGKLFQPDDHFNIFHHFVQLLMFNFQKKICFRVIKFAYFSPDLHQSNAEKNCLKSNNDVLVMQDEAPESCCTSLYIFQSCNTLYHQITSIKCNNFHVTQLSKKVDNFHMHKF